MMKVGRAAVLAAALGACALSCRVAESDVRRWETTERGPFKLVAVITHDKYSWELRTEAALSLVRMPPRGGQRKGIGFLIDKYKAEDETEKDGALVQLPEAARREIVARMAPELLKQLGTTPPARTEDGRMPADPSVPYKDATFAMLIHEPPLVSDEAIRTQLKDALTAWAQTGFEDRIENGSQQYGLEQMMRYLGAPSVRQLPALINENAHRVDRICALIADIGEDQTKLKASEALVALSKLYHSDEWLQAQTKIVKEHNAKNNQKADDNQVAGQVAKIQDRRVTEEVFPAMKKIGGRPAVEYLFGYAGDAKMLENRRKLALAALEGRVDKNNPQDLQRIFEIAKNNETPDSVRDVAFNRLGEFPKEQIVPKLYTLFDPPKWKVRWVAASLVLKTQGTKGVPEFMNHLPRTASTKMGMTEPLSYGGLIAKMEPGPGDTKPRAAITPYLGAKDLGPKLTALGFFWEGKKADRGAVQPFENDSSPLPKCEKEDECSWQCDVPKASNPKETEPKELKTVGEFVKFCLIPSMEK